MAVTQGPVAQVAVAALPPAAPSTGPASPGQAIVPIVMNFGTGVRRIEVQGY
jgi:hypothetical protein